MKNSFKIIILAVLCFNLPKVSGQSLSAIDPDSVYQGTSFKALITAQKTNFTKATFNAIRLTRGFNQINRDSFHVINDTALYAYFTIGKTSPVGAYNVIVNNSVDGNMNLAGSFWVLLSPTSPALLSIDPDSTFQGTSIKALILSKNTNFTTASFTVIRLSLGMNQINYDSFTVINDTALYAYFTIAISRPAGVYQLTVSNSIDGNLTLANKFWVLTSPYAPKLLSIDPDSVYQGTHFKALILGQNTNFIATTFSAIRLVQGTNIIPYDSFSIINDTAIYVYFTVSKTRPTGAYNLNVNSTIDGNLTLTGVFWVLKTPFTPVLLSIDPDSTEQGTSVKALILASNTSFTTANFTVIRLNQGTTQINRDSFTVINDTALYAYFTFQMTTAVGLYNLTVTNNLDGTLTLTQSFKVIVSSKAPKIFSVDPDTAIQGTKVSVTILGINTHFDSGLNLNVSLFMSPNTTINPDAITRINDTAMIADFTISTAVQTGLYDVRVSNSIDGQLTLPQSFTIIVNPNPPRILHADPDTLVQGQKYLVKIFATKTNFTKGNKPTVRLNFNAQNINADSVQVKNDTLLYAYFTIAPTATTGQYNLIVGGGADGNLTLPQAITIIISPTSPQISKINPTKAYQGQKVAIYVYGKNVTFTQGSNQMVRLTRGGGQFINPDSTKIIHDSLAIGYFSIPTNAQAGLYGVLLSGTIHGNLTLPQSFEILLPPTAPQIRYITPSRGTPGATMSITVYTSNTTLTKATNLTLNIFRQGGTNFNATGITVINDTSFNASVTIPNNAALGMYNARLQNTPEGTLLATNAFEVIPVPVIPLIKSVDPDSAYYGQNNLTMKINCSGTKFTRAKLLKIEIISPSTNLLAIDSQLVVNDTVVNIYFSVPKNAELGYYDIVITTDIEGMFMLTKGFRVLHNVSVPENEILIAVYPNPVHDNFYLSSGENITGVKVFDMTGKLITSTENICRQQLSINLSDQPEGYYLIQVETASYFKTIRVLKY